MTPVRALPHETGTRRVALILVVAAMLAALLAIPGAARPAAVLAADCDVAGTTWTASASVDQGLTTMFAEYGNEKKGWSGGDSTYSVPLSDRDKAWFFSDTLMGVVEEDGSQPDLEFVNSSIVVQHKDEIVRTVTGGTGSNPTGLLPPPDDGWYWLGASQLRDDGSEIQTIFLRFERFGPGQWDWRWAENVLGRIDADSLNVEATVPLPSASGVNWASWLSREGDHTLIYGVEDLGLEKFMHVARVAGDDLGAPWEYWTGTGWSAVETDSARIMPGVANEYSVSPFGDGYLLVTQDTLELFSRNIVAYVGCSPTGPFTRIGTLYVTPETGLFGTYGNPNIFTYNAHEHPELRDDDSILVTYNVNSFNPDDLYADVTIYRPRFIRVELTPG